MPKDFASVENFFIELGFQIWEDCILEDSDAERRIQFMAFLYKAPDSIKQKWAYTLATRCTEDVFINALEHGSSECPEFLDSFYQQYKVLIGNGVDIAERPHRDGHTYDEYKKLPPGAYADPPDRDGE